MYVNVESEGDWRCSYLAALWMHMLADLLQSPNLCTLTDLLTFYSLKLLHCVSNIKQKHIRRKLLLQTNPTNKIYLYYKLGKNCVASYETWDKSCFFFQT